MAEPSFAVQMGVTLVDNQLLVTPQVSTDGPKASLHYELHVHKKGPSGTTTTRQDGTVTIPTSESKSLLRLTLRVAPTDTYSINLQVFQGERLVAQGAIHYPQ